MLLYAFYLRLCFFFYMEYTSAYNWCCRENKYSSIFNKNTLFIFFYFSDTFKWLKFKRQKKKINKKEKYRKMNTDTWSEQSTNTNQKPMNLFFCFLFNSNIYKKKNQQFIGFLCYCHTLVILEFLFFGFFILCDPFPFVFFCYIFGKNHTVCKLVPINFCLSIGIIWWWYLYTCNILLSKNK